MTKLKPDKGQIYCMWIIFNYKINIIKNQGCELKKKKKEGTVIENNKEKPRWSRPFWGGGS